MAQQLGNIGFESCTFSNGKHLKGSDADSTKTWSFHGNAGVHQTGSVFNGKGATLTAPNGGSVAAFLFPTNGSVKGNGLVDADSIPRISQTFKVSTQTTYTLSFYSCQQNSSTTANLLTTRLRSADGSDNREWIITPGTSYAQTTIALGTLPATIYTLTFEASSPPFIGVRGATTYSGTYVSGMVFVDDASIT